MTVRQQWTAVVAVVLVLTGVLVAATRSERGRLFPVEVGSEAPDFKATTITEPVREKSLRDYRGQVVLLNLWATWCPPCRAEMPSIESLYRDYGRYGLKVVAVSADDPGPTTRQKIRDFVKEFGLTFEVLHDQNMQTERAFQVTGYPETFIIGPDGTIRKKVIAAADWNSPGNRALIEQLLNEARRAKGEPPLPPVPAPAPAPAAAPSTIGMAGER